MLRFMQHIVNLLPDEETAGIGDQLNEAMSESDPGANAGEQMTNRINWTFGLTQLEATEPASQVCFTPEGDLVGLEDSQDVVPIPHTTEYHDPELCYVMLQRYSNLMPKYNAFLASMHNVSLLSENPSKTTGSSSNVDKINNPDNVSSSKDNEIDDDNKPDSGGTAERSTDGDEFKEAIASLVENLHTLWFRYLLVSTMSLTTVHYIIIPHAS